MFDRDLKLVILYPFFPSQESFLLQEVKTEENVIEIAYDCFSRTTNILFSLLGERICGSAVDRSDSLLVTYSNFH
jgi:hypothetical protein